MISLCLRYDDFSACSSTEVEAGLIGLFLKYRIPCVFAVVPFMCEPETLLNAGAVELKPLPKAKADLLQPLLKEGLTEIALHGYSHLTLAPVRGHQEFSERMPRETQRLLVRKGREYLEDVFQTRVNLYVPPWNRLAASTAAVLGEEGFMLSGDIPETAEPHSFALAQMPCGNQIRQTGAALKAAGWFRGGSPSVGTVIHDYDFVESKLGTAELTLSQFEEIAGQWKERDGVEFRLLSQCISAGNGRGDERIRNNFTLRKAVNGSRLARRLFPSARGVYWDGATAGRLAGIMKFFP